MEVLNLLLNKRFAMAIPENEPHGIFFEGVTALQTSTNKRSSDLQGELLGASHGQGSSGREIPAF